MKAGLSLLCILGTALLYAAPPISAVEAEWSFSTAAPMLSSPKFADVDGDGTEEVILTTYGQGPDAYDSGWIHVLDADGNPLPGWPFYTDFGPFAATACVGDIDGEPGVEILAGDWHRLHLLDSGGNELPGWPRTMGVNYTPALADMDHDGDLEIIVPSAHGMHVLQADGSELPGWPRYAPEALGAPAVGDLDGDGEMEIIAGTLQGPVGPEPFEVYVWEHDGTVKTGFPKSTSGVCKAPPAIGDLDGDGACEIVIPAYDVSNDDYLYVWTASGETFPGWPRRAGRCRLSAPALVDLDADGELEIVIGSGRATAPLSSMLYAFEPSGDAVPGFPITIPQGAQVNSGPIVADLDGDDDLLEIVVKVQDYFYAYHSDGTLVDGYPYYLSDESHSGTTTPSPVMGDVDHDGDPEMVFCSAFDNVDFIDLDVQVDMSLAYWPSFKLDAENTSFVITDYSSVPGLREPIAGVVQLFQNVPNPLRAGQATLIPLRAADAAAGGEFAPLWIQVLDLEGRSVRSLRVGQQQIAGGGVAWDGRDARGQTVPSGVYFYRLSGSISGATHSLQVVR